MDAASHVRNNQNLKQRLHNIVRRQPKTISAALQSAALEASADAIVITDSRGIILWLNKAFTRLTGYSSRDAIGKNMSILKSGAQDTTYYEHFWKEISSGHFIISDIVNRRKDGSLYHEEESVTPVVGNDGTVSYYISIKRDITARIQTEKQLRLARTYAEDLINSMVDGVWIVNAKGETTDANPAVLRLLGFDDKTELIGHGLLSFIPASERKQVQKSLDGLIISGTVGSGTTALLHRHSGLIPVTYTFSLADKVNGATNKIILVVRDMTELKQAEKSVREMSISAATEKEMADQAVAKAEKLKELDKSKDEFFNIASHELRTPLAAIRGNAALIRDHYAKQSRDTNFKELVTDILEASGRLIAIVNDFLDTSRLEQKRMIYNFVSFDIVELAKTITQFYAVSVAAQNNRLVLQEPKSTIPKVWADHDRTKQVLINLIGNAAKFTENGKITISFEVVDGYVKINVTDTGRGMAPETQKLLFKKFEQAGDKTAAADAIRGTGLGLYISKMIIEQMHSRLRLESSQLGVGSTFSFSLPTVNPKSA